MNKALSPATWHSETNKDRTAWEDLPFPVPPPCPVCGDPGPCQCAGNPLKRPQPPQADAYVWYRGWEVGYDHDADYWSGEGWIAYKGGCDLGAPEVRAGTYQACLDAVDEKEEG